MSESVWKRLPVWAGLMALCLAPAAGRGANWVTAYYPGYRLAGMPASNIDFSTVTHVVHFSVTPGSNGTLNASDNSITVAGITDLVTRAHAAGRKVLIGVGGAGTETGFQTAVSNKFTIFLKNITNYVAAYSYDGVDIDWEPLPSSDMPQFTNLAVHLRSVLSALSPAKLLTAAVDPYPTYGDNPTNGYLALAAVQGQFDQINLMTYDMAGPWSTNWMTWYNSPVFDGGARLFDGRVAPSIDGGCRNCQTNGIAPGKLGLGIPFYGYAWAGGPGVAGPYLSWPVTNPPTATACTYTQILAAYYNPAGFHWDANAAVPYLSITNGIKTNNVFVSYDNDVSCQAKVNYMRNHGLGGLIIWELSQDFYSATNQPLLRAIGQALAAPAISSLLPGERQAVLNFNGLALGSYRVQWTGSLPGGIWNTLCVTNPPGTGGVIQVTDPAPPAQRFYRIQSPP